MVERKENYYEILGAKESKENHNDETPKPYTQRFPLSLLIS